MIDLVDIFAITVLHGHLSNPSNESISFEDLAEYSYELADTMMKARQENGQS